MSIVYYQIELVELGGCLKVRFTPINPIYIFDFSIKNQTRLRKKIHHELSLWKVLSKFFRLGLGYSNGLHDFFTGKWN